MAQDATVTIVPGRGHFYTAPVDTVYPTDPAAPSTPWEEVGHTSLESPMQLTRNGGDETVLGSWQDPTLKTIQEKVIYRVAFALLQHDVESLKLYYGGNSTVDGTTNRVKVPKSPKATETALFLRIVDGANEEYRYYPKVTILAADSEEFDVEKLASMPVAATILGSTGADHNAEIAPPVDTSAA